MEYNKRQFQKARDKRVLHKVRKHWVVVSLALLMAIGGKVAAGHINTHADVNSNNNQLTSNTNAIKEQLNQKLVKIQNNQSQGKINQNSQNIQNQQKQSIAPHTRNNVLNSNYDTFQITKQAQFLHQQILNNTLSESDMNNTNVSQSQQTPNSQNKPSITPINHFHRLLGSDSKSGSLDGLNYTFYSDNNNGLLEFTSGTADSDLSDLDGTQPTFLSQVANQLGFFGDSSQIHHVKFDKDVNLSNVYDLSGFFYNDNQLSTVDFGSTSTPKLTKLSNVFGEDTSFSYIVLPRDLPGNVSLIKMIGLGPDKGPGVEDPILVTQSPKTALSLDNFDSSSAEIYQVNSSTPLSDTSSRYGEFFATPKHSYEPIPGQSNYINVIDHNPFPSSELGSDWAYVNDKAQHVSSPMYVNSTYVPENTTGDNTTRPIRYIMVAPSYKGVTYKYNPSDGSLELISGNFDSSNLSYLFAGPKFGGTTGFNSGTNTTLKSIKIDDGVGLGNNVHSLANMFSGLPNLQSLTIPNSFNTHNVTNMSNMFGQDGQLQSLQLPNSFDTINVTNMSNMFGQDGQLQSLQLPDSFDTSNVTNMSDMFGQDGQLQSLQLPSSFNTHNVTNMSDMFQYDGALQSLTLPNSFDTSDVNDMNNIFSHVVVKSLVLPNHFNTIKANRNNKAAGMFGYFTPGPFMPSDKIESLTITSPDTIIDTSSCSDFPAMYKQLSMKDSNGNNYTLATPNDFSKGNVGTFLKNPNPVIDNINYVYKGRTIYSQSFTWNYKDAQLDVNNNDDNPLQSSSDDYELTQPHNYFPYDGKTHNVALSPKYANETLEYQYNGQTLGSYNVGGYMVSDELDINNNYAPGLPQYYHLASDYTYPAYDGHTKIINILPSFKTDSISFHNIYDTPSDNDDPLYANKTVNDKGRDNENNGHPIYNFTSADVPAGFVTVDNKGNVVNPNMYDFDFNNGTHVINVAHIYDGLAYRYNSNNNSVEFVSGNLNWNGNSGVPFIGSGYGPSQLQNANSITFGPNVNMSGLNSTHLMFKGDNHLQHLNLGNAFNTRNVNDMSGMFQSDGTLHDITLGTNFNTDNVTNMADMFRSDGSLNQINGLTNLDISHVNNITRMFNNDTTINELNLSSWDVNKVNTMSDVFSGDKNLKILDLSSWTPNAHGQGDDFNGDNALMKLSLNSGFHLNNLNNEFANCNFFNSNVDDNGLWSTNAIKNGTQNSNSYYAAKPITINDVYPGNKVVNTNKPIGIPLSPDSDYHGKIRNQITGVGIVTPIGYHLDSNNSYVIQNNNNNPYININLDLLRASVPVQFINNARGHQDVIYSYITPTTSYGDTININLTLPKGYSWNQPTPSSNKLLINVGHGPGQISNNSGRTNPLKFYVKGNAVKVPVSYINQVNDLDTTTFISTYVDSDISWPTTTGVTGLNIDPGQQGTVHVEGTYINNGDNNYMNNNGNTNFIHLDPNRSGYTQVHYMNVSAQATHVLTTITTVKQSPNKTYYGTIKVPVEGHVDDSYTVSDNDFNVPKGYTLTTPNNTYTAKLTAPGQYQWNQTNNPWDNADHRPEIVYTADNAGAINIRYINQNNQEVGNETTVTGKVGGTDNLQQNASVPAGYNYDAARMGSNPTVTFANQPQTFTVYVVGQQRTITAQYNCSGISGNAINDGTISGRVGDVVQLPTNHVPTGYVISSANNLGQNHHGSNLNYLIQPNNSTQYIDLNSRQLVLPVQFKNVGINANPSDQLVGPVNYTIQGTLNNSTSLPSAPQYYQYASGQPTSYQFESDQINPRHSDQMNMATVNVVGMPTQTKVSYVDPVKHTISSYVASDYMGTVATLNHAPQGYALDDDNDVKYTPLPMNVQSIKADKAQMKDYVVPIHAQYYQGIQKYLTVDYDNSNHTVQSQVKKAITVNGYSGDQFTFDPKSLNVPAGYTLDTTNLDRAQINPNGTATWLNGNDPTIVFKANSVKNNLHVTQIEELPNHTVIGTHKVLYPVSGDVGQSYSVADNQIPVPQDCHLASNDNTMQGQITADGITNNHAMLYYVKNSANDIEVHYKIHGHSSDISSYDYNKNNYNDAYVGESINGFDHVPQGYCLDVNNTPANDSFTFSNNHQDKIIYVSPCTPKKNAVEVNVILQNVNGQPISDPTIPALSSVKGQKGYQVLVPVNPDSSENFTITPSDAHLSPRTNGYVPYQDNNISGIQKADGLDITSPNKNTFVYRASTDPKQAGSIDIKYMNQNGQIVNNTTNNQSDYVIPGGYRGRYVTDVTKLAKVPGGYQLLNTDQKAYTFNGNHQTALMIVNGKTFNDKVHVLRVEEDPNDQTSKTVSDYYDIPNARVGNSYMISALDYIPDGYDEDTSNNLDQSTTFTVQPDGTLNNGAAVTFYYRSNADRYLSNLKDITVSYRVHYQDGSSHLVSDDRLMNHGIINPDQVPDVYDGQMVPDVTKYVPTPNGYHLDTTPKQDVQAMVSDTHSPKVTLNVSPTDSNHHNSDDQTNAQPIFTAFENNDGQVIDEEGNLIGDHGHVDPAKANQELRLDGPMGHKINPLDTYPVPAGYHLADNQIPVYEITNQVQHHIINVQPNPDSTRNYHLTIKTLTPSDQSLNTVHSDIEIPVKINKTVTIKPSTYNVDPTNYQFDSGASTDGGNLHITNTNLHLNENSGTLVYKAQPNSDVGTITVSYFDGPQFINRGVIQGQYAQQKYTVSDIANNVAPSQGFQVNSNQKHTYVIGDSGNQNVNIYVHGHANKPSDKSDVVVVTLVKEDNTGKKIASNNVNYAINKSVGDDYTIDPNEFLPQGFKLDKSHAGRDNPINGMVQADGLSKAGATFYYQSTQSPAPIYLKYINQAGNQVGSVTKLTGGYGHTISDITKQSDGGVNLPNGYQLTSSLNQLTSYTFGNNAQHIDLFITGQPTTNQYAVKVVKNNGSDPQTTQTIIQTYHGRVGDQIDVDPTNYQPINYQLANQDHDQFITAATDQQTNPTSVTFVYNEPLVIGHVIYRDDATNEVVGNQPIVGIAGSQMAPQYSDYETYLPYGYDYDRIDSQNSPKLENNAQYFIYLKKLPVKAQTTPTQNPLGYVNVEYRDTANGRVVNTVKVAGDLGHSFNANDYTVNLPNGYNAGRLDKQSARPAQFEKDTEPTVIVDMNENGPQISSDVIDTIKYVDSDGHVVNSRQVTGLKGDSIDWSQYAAYVPKGYVYDYMGSYEMNLTGKTNVIYIQPDTPQIQYGTVNLNYVDASDGNKPIMTNQIYGIDGSVFNLAQYEDNLPTYSDSYGPHSYQFQSDHGDITFFNTGIQSVTIAVHKAPKPQPKYSTVTIDYVDADTHKAISDSSVTISGLVGDVFDPTVFENNLPQNYDFVRVHNPVYVFNVTPHTITIDVKPQA